MRSNSILSTGFLSCAMAVGLLASAANAGAQSTSLAVANVPFSFQIGSHQMPAGTYNLSRGNGNIILVQNRNGKASQYVMSYPALSAQARQNGRLVFGHYGSRYFLHEIWSAGSSVGLKCPQDRAREEVLSARSQQPEGQFDRQPGGEVEIALVAER